MENTDNNSAAYNNPNKGYIERLNYYEEKRTKEIRRLAYLSPIPFILLLFLWWKLDGYFSDLPINSKTSELAWKVKRLDTLINSLTIILDSLKGKHNLISPHVISPPSSPIPLVNIDPLIARIRQLEGRQHEINSILDSNRSLLPFFDLINAEEAKLVGARDSLKIYKYQLNNLTRSLDTVRNDLQKLNKDKTIFTITVHPNEVVSFVTSEYDNENTAMNSDLYLSYSLTPPNFIFNFRSKNESKSNTYSIFSKCWVSTSTEQIKTTSNGQTRELNYAIKVRQDTIALNRPLICVSRFDYENYSYTITPIAQSTNRPITKSNISTRPSSVIFRIIRERKD